MLATLLLRDWDVGALVAGVVIAAVPALPFVFVALAGVARVPDRPRSARTGRAAAWPGPRPGDRRPSLLNLIATIALVISAGQLLIAGGCARAGDRDALGTAAADAPDIYVILLDGHPRSDTLASEFGFDEEPFLTAMEGEGFEVARASRSNYNMTELTFSSMFQMQQLPDVPAPAIVRPNTRAGQPAVLQPDRRCARVRRAPPARLRGRRHP